MRPVWRAIAVPSDKNQAREDLIFAHRLWYRTRIAVPAALAGRAHYALFIGANGSRCFWQVVNGLWVTALVALAAVQLLHQVNDVHPAARSQDAIDARHLLGNLNAVTLCQAAGRDEQLTCTLSPGELLQDIDRLFFGRADEPACIDDQDIGFVWIGLGTVAIAGQQLRHRIGVDCVLGTAK